MGWDGARGTAKQRQRLPLVLQARRRPAGVVSSLASAGLGERETAAQVQALAAELQRSNPNYQRSHTP